MHFPASSSLLVLPAALLLSSLSLHPHRPVTEFLQVLWLHDRKDLYLVSIVMQSSEGFTHINMCLRLCLCWGSCYSFLHCKHVVLWWAYWGLIHICTKLKDSSVSYSWCGLLVPEIGNRLRRMLPAFSPLSDALGGCWGPLALCPSLSDPQAINHGPGPQGHPTRLSTQLSTTPSSCPRAFPTFSATLLSPLSSTAFISCVGFLWKYG